MQNGEAELVHHFLLSGDPDEMIFTIGVRMDDPPDAGELEAIRTAWTTHFDGQTSNQYTYKGISLKGIDNLGDPWEASSPDTQVGNNSSAVLPSNCCVLVRKLTGVPGRANRGRMYVPGIVSEGAVDANGVITTLEVEAIQDLFDDWSADVADPFTTGIEGFLVLHPEDPGTLITQFVVDARIATQRRRMRG